MSTNSGQKALKFLDKLKKWAIEGNIGKQNINSLLKILKEEGHDVPLDYRTLLQTPRVNDNTTMDNGLFKYFGIENQLKSEFEKNVIDPLNVPKILNIEINTDGLQINKNSECFWPILIFIREKILFDPVIVACFYGQNKPPNANMFLIDFVTECKKLMQSGFIFKTKTFFIRPFSINCDTPARCFINITKNHNYTFGCGKCKLKGVSLNRKMAFLKTKNLQLRTAYDDETNYFLPEKSLLIELGLNLITDSALDSMHLVYLGVMKKFLNFLIEGRLKLNNQNNKLLEKKINLVRKRTTNNFGRSLSPFYVVNKWKATEYRQFLLYVGIYILKDLVPENVYNLFLTLHVGVRILEHKDYCQNEDYNRFANKLLINFVDNFKIIFGGEYCSFNVHNLLHLSNECMKFGSLTEFSCFKFENKLGKIKRLIKSSGNCLSQLNNRIIEHNLNSFSSYEHVKVYPICKKEVHNDTSIHKQSFNFSENCKFFEYYEDSNLVININDKDNFFVLKDNNFVEVKYVVINRVEVVLIAKKFTNKKPFYTTPINSETFFNICLASGDGHLISVKLTEVNLKCFSINVNVIEKLLIPLLHKAL